MVELYCTRNGDVTTRPSHRSIRPLTVCCTELCTLFITSTLLYTLGTVSLFIRGNSSVPECSALLRHSYSVRTSYNYNALHPNRSHCKNISITLMHPKNTLVYAMEYPRLTVKEVQCKIDPSPFYYPSPI